MSTSNPTKGSCLCGGVSFEAVLPAVRFHYCHCVSCRKATSSVHGAILVFNPEQFRWLSGEASIERFTDQSANPGYMRWFCRRCGSAVPRLSRTKQHILVPAGLLDEDPGIKPEQHIFWDERAAWLGNADAMPKFSEGIDSAIRSKGEPGRNSKPGGK